MVNNMETIYINTSILPVVDYAGYGDEVAEKHRNPSVKYYTMIYVTGGTLSVSENREHYTVKEGSVIFLHKNSSRAITPEDCMKVSYIYVNFFMQHFDIIPDGKTTLGKTVCIPHTTAPEIRYIYPLPHMLEKINGSVLDKKIHDYAEYFNSPGRLTDLEINTRFYDILSECVKYNRDLYNPHGKLSDRIINYLNEHMTEQLSTSDMEKKFYLTYKYMGTAFKKETGETILGYHTKLRMNYAKRLILTTFYGIDEISRMTGYTDALYFSRVFKKHYGSSPQNFRKSGKPDD